MGSSALIAVRVPITRIHTTSALTIISHRLEIFRLPYELYVDASPGQALYRALGMGHSRSSAHKTRPTTEGSATGSYVRHGAVSGLAMVVRHALRVAMPVWERGGDAAQLGGEFVLGPGYVPKPPCIFPFLMIPRLSCTYAHRMQSSAGHAPIVDVLAAAGVRPARKNAGGGPVAPPPSASASAAIQSAAAGVGTPSTRPNERGREAKVLSVVREEACGTCGSCEGCAEALNIDLESTASGEWSMVVTGSVRPMR